MKYSKAALTEALSLSEEVLKNLELSELPLTNIALKAARLARLLTDIEMQAILEYEAGGYPTTPNGVDPKIYHLAVKAHRQQEYKDPKTDSIKQFIYLERISVLENNITISEKAISAARTEALGIRVAARGRIGYEPSHEADSAPF